MNRTIQSQLTVQAGKFTEAEQVLLRQLAAPPLQPVPRTWLRRIARGFTALFVAQTILAVAPAYAQVTAAPGAQAGQKPLMDAAANGTPIVLIAPPSRAGVSRNLYDQFNVDKRGLILNNSTGNVQTQLGGWISGNLQLGQTPARIILNEVTGANASQLKGYIEIGGQKADLVIANPNGITCNGCGFLNANRATLTTGTPQFGADGALTGLDVRQGVLSVGPGGLDATEQQQLDIIARGLLVEGEVFTQKLQAIIGANQVVYGTLAATAQASTGDAPRFAVDIKDMGGMYAGQIYLIATDKGLGVNSAGRMSTLAGNFILSANGDLTLKDSYSSQDMQLASTGRTTLTGQTLAEGKVQIDARQRLVNSGTLQAATLAMNTPGISNSGSIAQTAPGANMALTLPGGLTNSGAIYTPGNLTVSAAALTSGSIGTATGSLLAGGAMTIATEIVDMSRQQLAANQDINVRANALRVTSSGIQAGGKVTLEAAGAVDLTETTVMANGIASVNGQSIALDRSKVAALGNVQLTGTGQVSANTADISSNTAVGVQGSSISMRSGSVTAVTTASIEAQGEIRLDSSVVTAGQQVSVKGEGVNTAGAAVAAPRVVIDAGTGALSNQGGKVLASSAATDALTVSAVSINNKGGELRANGGLTLDTKGGQIDNTQGVIAGTTGTLANMSGLTNKGGVFYTESDLSLSGTALDNGGGAIVTKGRLAVTTPGQTIQNAGGLLQADGAVALDAGSAALNNAAGSVVAGGALSVKAGAVDTSIGTLAAGGQLDVTAASLTANGSTLGSGGAMNLAVTGDANLNTATANSGGNLTLQASTVQATGATVKSNADTQVTANSITGGSWQGQGNVTATAQGALNLTGGGLLAGNNVSATGQGITTDNAEISGKNVTLNAGTGALSNLGGKINATATTGTALNITASGLTNADGTLGSRADATINVGTQVVNNTGGTIQVDGNLQMTASQLINRGGTINTGSSLAFQGFALDNNAGKIQTKGNLTIDTAGQTLDNTAGTLKADGHTSLTAGAILSNGGVISAGTSTTDGKVTVRATSLDATNGRVSGSRELDILVTQRLAVGGATLETGGKLTAGASNIDAQGATLNAGETLNATATGALDTTGATITALGAQAGDIQLTAVSIAARGAKIKGDAAVTLTSGGALDVDTAQVTAIKSLSATGAGALTGDGASLKTNENLTLSGSSVVATGATLSAGGKAEVRATAGSATLNNATLLAGDTAKVTATGIAASAAKIGAVNNVTLQAGTGDFTAAGVLVQSQNGSASLAAATVNAAGNTAAGSTPTTGFLAGQTIAITATGAVDVSKALTVAGTSVTVTSDGAINNDGGRILANITASLTGTSLSNQSGIVDATGPLGISVSQGQVNNDQGRISTRDVLTMTAPSGSLSSLSNAGGIIDTAGAFNVQLQNFNNAGGSVTALAGLTIAGGTVTNTSGTLASEGNVSVNTQGGIFAGEGGNVLSTQGNVSLTTGAAALDESSVKAQGAVTVTSTSASASSAIFQANTGAVAINAGTGAAAFNNSQLLSGQNVTLTAGRTSLNNATVTSGGNATLTTGALQVSQAVINAQGDFAVNATGTVTADKAQIAAGGKTTITATTGIDLNNGSVNAQTIDLRAGTGQLNSTAGTLIAVATTGTALNLQSQGLLNAGGTIASGADLSVNAGAGNLANTSGSMLAVGAADIKSTGLTNTNGTIASNGALTVNAAQANALTKTDNTGGTIRSAQSSVSLMTGELVNSRANVMDAGSLITGATTVTVNATGPVNNTRAEISAGTGDLAVTASGALTNDQGRLTGERDSAVTASAIGNTGGLIAGNRNTVITATAGGVTNTSGTVQAVNNLAITATGAVANDSGKLQAGSNLTLTGGTLTNSQGEISAGTGSATLTVTSYSNTPGSVVAGGALIMNTQGGSLSANGSTFASGGDMTLRGGAAQFNDANVTAGGSLDAQVSSLESNRATVQAAGQLTANAGTGALNAASSIWKAGQGVALTGGATSLTDSTVAGNGTVAVTGANIDATRASISSPGDVRVAASGTLHIGDATLLAGQDLAATGTGAGTTAGAIAMAGRDLTLGNGAAFDFAAPDLQYGFNRNLMVRAQGISAAGQTVAAQNLTLDAGAGILNNQGGTLNATGALSVSGTGLNNQSGVIAANGQVTAAAGTGTLNNAGGQIYSAQGAAIVSGTAIENAAGSICAATDLNLSGGTLNNTGNTLAAGRNVTASMTGQVTNTGGRIIANTGAASVVGNGIQNTNGVIAGVTGAIADAGSGTLTNTGGQVSGQAVIIGGAVDNSSGVISGSNSVAMTIRAINNDAGVIEAGSGGITINTQGNTLTNTNSGTTRGIVSTGAIGIAAGDINNQSGYIGASGGLNITQSSSINNQGGTLLGLGASSITTTGTLNNQGGSVKSNANLTVAAGTLNNSNAGVVFANGNLTVTASSIDNSNTKNAGYTTGLLAAGNATITAPTINNANGAIVSLGDTTVIATSSLANTGGQIAGNTVRIVTDSLANTGGRADAQQRMSADIKQGATSGTLASNGDFDLTLQGDQVNTGTYSANGSLNVTVNGGKLTNTSQGHISAPVNLTLTANGGIDNAGTIDSQATTLNTTGVVNNAGLINSTDGPTAINAGTLNNTGKVYGNSVTITGAANNSKDTAGAGAVIASRSGDVTVNGALNNTDGGYVFGLGNIQLNGTVWNDGSTINATGNVGITGNLRNTNAGLTTSTQTRSEPGSGTYITPSGSTTQYKVTDLGWRGDSGGLYVLPSTTYPFATFGTNMLVGTTSCSYTDASDNCSYNYTPGDAVFTRFGITVGATPPGTPPAANGCMISGEASDSRDMSGVCGAYWNSVDTYTNAVFQSYAQLDAAINAFNADLNNRSIIDWYRTDITGKTIVETSVTSSKPGVILAGGNITLAAGTNKDSRIVASGTVSLGGVTNDATQGTRQTTEEGAMVFSHREWHGGFSSSYSRSESAPQPIANPATTQSFPLPIDYVAVAPTSGTSSPVGAAAAVVPGVGASATGARGTNGTSGQTGSTLTGTPATGSGNAVTVATTTTGTPQSATGPTNVTGGTSNTVAATTGTGPISGTAATLTTGVNAAPAPALPGSVVAAKVRTDQAQVIGTSLTNFAALAAAVPQMAQAVDTSARQAALPAVRAAGYKTVTASGAVFAPNSQLFSFNRSPGRPLVETDPAFTSYRNFISSAYFLTQLNLDPERTMKRYGDGFAEQRLIDDQIMALTGRRFLTNYTSTEDEYQDLLNVGVMYAKDYQLSPGVSLSAEQMATLTTDMVWLEAKTVTLPDGSTTQVLVPTVYLRRPVESDLTPTGTLIAGSNVTLRSPGDVMNSGAIVANGDAAAGNGKLTISGDNVSNSGTLGGNVISVTAQNTLVNAGGVIQGTGQGSSVSLNARDITLRTTTQTNVREIVGPNGVSTGQGVNVDRIATIAADSVTLAALKDINLTGATVRAGNDLTLTAGGKVTSDSVATGYTLNVPLGGEGAQGRTSNYNVAATAQQLTALEAGKNVVVTATGDASFRGTNASAGADLAITAQNISIEAAKNSLAIDQQGVSKRGYERVAQSDEALAGGNLTAGNNASLVAAAGGITASGANISAANGAAALTATGDITIQSAITNHSLVKESYSRRSGFLSSSSNQRDSSSVTTVAEGSSVGGATVSVVAGQDINVNGSNVASDTQTTLGAGRNVNIAAATETQTSSSFVEEQNSGFGALGGLSYGTRQQSTDAAQTATRAVASNVGSLQGNVAITAGQAYNQVGSNLVAPVGNIDIAAKSVNIVEARETATSQYEEKFQKSGISVNINSPILSALETTNQMAKQSGNTGDARTQALALAGAASALNDAAKAVAADPAHAGGVGINVTLGTQQHQSTSAGNSNTAAGSTVAAGGNVTIEATAGDVTVRGSQVSAGNNANLTASGAVNLLAAQNTAEQHSTNSGSSASIGVGLNFGAQGAGISISASASSNKGNSDGADLTDANTKVTAGNTVNIQSGGDATLKGAVVAANTVNAQVGGNLNVQSLQDTSTFNEKQTSSGFGVTVPIVGTQAGVSVSGGKTKIDSTYQSVGEQTAIRAGDGGFNVNVSGATTLTGGAITSTQKAIDDGKNTFASAGGVTTTDIQNTASYNASGASVTVGSSGGGQVTPGKAVNSGGIGSKDGDASSVTTAAISGVAGNTAARTGDAETGLKPIFDANTVRNDVNAQIAITKAALPGVTKAWADFASTQEQKASTPENRACWAEEGACRVAGHIAIGALAGGTSGAAGAGLSQAVVQTIGDALKGADLPEGVKQGVIAGLSAAIGGAAGGTAGAVAGGSATVNNYLYSFKGKIVARDRNDNNKVIVLSEKDMQTLSAAEAELLMKEIAGINGDGEPALISGYWATRLKESRVYDMSDPKDRAALTKETDMGYIDIDDKRTRVYFQNGMENTAKEAQTSAERIAALMGQPVGVIINSTQGLPKDVEEYLPKAPSVKDALNEYTYQTLNEKGPTLIVMHSAGNEDAAKALQLGTLYGHQYSNLNFVSLGSPVSNGKLQSVVLKANANYVGQVNDWRDPVTYSRTTVASALALTGAGVWSGASAGAAVGVVGGPLGIALAGGLGGGVGALAGFGGSFIAVQKFHPMESYLKKPQVQSILFNWQPTKVLPR